MLSYEIQRRFSEEVEKLPPGSTDLMNSIIDSRPPSYKCLLDEDVQGTFRR